MSSRPALLVFGRPTDQQKARPKPARFEKDAVVCENTYRDRTDAELRADFICPRRRQRPAKLRFRHRHQSLLQPQITKANFSKEIDEKRGSFI